MGDMYRVLVDGAHLDGWEFLEGPPSMGKKGVTQHLLKGSIIERVGNEDMDGILVQTFKDENGFVGAFWPNNFGNPLEYLEKIE